MEKIKLRPVTSEYEEAIMAYRQAFLDRKEVINGSSGLDKFDSFRDWQDSLILNSYPISVEEGYVPAATFLAVSQEDGRLVGLVNIRHRLSSKLLNFGGHIGCSVLYSERRKGFGGQILDQALAYCDFQGINQVLITCDKANLPSARTIQSRGAYLENEISFQGRTIQRYWINLLRDKWQINHMTLEVEDLDRSKAFYQSLFKRPVLAESDQLIYFDLDGLWFALNKKKTGSSGSYSHIAFSLTEDQQEGLIHGLEDQEIKWTRGRSRSAEEGQSLYLEDPDGHLIEFHAKDLKARLAYYRDKRPDVTVYKD